MMHRAQRPVVPLPLTQNEWLLEAVGMLALLALFSVTFYYLPRLPATIPTHFNGAGQVDGHGPVTMYPTPIYLGLALYALLTLVGAFPRICNFPVPVTPENAERLYRLARGVLRLLKILMLGVFTYLQWTTAQVALGAAHGLNNTVMFGWLGALGALVVGFVVQTVRAR